LGLRTPNPDEPGAPVDVLRAQPDRLAQTYTKGSRHCHDGGQTAGQLGQELVQLLHGESTLPGAVLEREVLRLQGVGAPVVVAGSLGSLEDAHHYVDLFGDGRAGSAFISARLYVFVHGARGHAGEHRVLPEEPEPMPELFCVVVQRRWAPPLSLLPG